MNQNNFFTDKNLHFFNRLKHPHYLENVQKIVMETNDWTASIDGNTPHTLAHDAGVMLAACGGHLNNIGKEDDCCSFVLMCGYINLSFIISLPSFTLIWLGVIYFLDIRDTWAVTKEIHVNCLWLLYVIMIRYSPISW